MTDDELAQWQADDAVDMRTFAVLWHLHRLQGSAPYVQIPQPVVAAQIKTSLRSVNRAVAVLKRIGAIRVTRWTDGVADGLGYVTLAPGARSAPTQATPQSSPATPAASEATPEGRSFPKDSLCQDSPLPPSPGAGAGAREALGFCPDDFRPSPTVVETLVGERPDLRDRIDSLTETFIASCQARRKQSPDFDKYFLTFARGEKPGRAHRF